jgi:uncharacterized SAM-dependent methyltransferase
MLYFRNVDITKRYPVSEATVRKWIKAAERGKLALKLHDDDGKLRIANTADNVALIEQIVAERRKYRTTAISKTVTPRPEFYRLYNEAQIYDIVRNLELHHEIPRQYNYFDGGAGNWDKHAQRLAAEDVPNLLNRTVELLDENRRYIDKRLEKFDRINVIDIGPGNALPVKALLAHLLESGKLGRYVALDISEEMLHIAERNIKEWFGGKVAFEGHVLNINYETFANLVAEDYLHYGGRDTMNLVLFLGGTPYNFRKPDAAFGIIHDSMNRNDILIYTDKLETEGMRPEWFNFNPEQNSAELAPNHRFIFDLLNIDPSFYEVEMGFDQASRQRYIRVRLKVALTIKFMFDVGEYLLEMDKGETILLWRAWEVTARDVELQHERNDFNILHSSQSDDNQYILAMSRVKVD